MNIITQTLIAVFTFIALSTIVYAQSPAEELLQQMVEQLQSASANDARSLREKIISLAATITPAPAIPEEARRQFIIGESLFKQATNQRLAFEASNAFSRASTLAPWWGDAYWNLALAQQLAWQYVSAKESLEFYLLTHPGAEDKRLAQDRLYALDADLIAAQPVLSGGLIGFWQESGMKTKASEAWNTPFNPDWGRNGAFEIQQNGVVPAIKCVECIDAKGVNYTMNVTDSDSAAISFQKKFQSKIYSQNDRYECKLKRDQLICEITSTGPAKKYFQRYTKRRVCEVVGDPGIQHAPVLCR